MPTSTTRSRHSNAPKTRKTRPRGGAKATATKGTPQNAAAAAKAVKRAAKRKPAPRRKKALQAVQTTPTPLRIRFPNPAAVITVNTDNKADEEDEEDEEDEAPPPYMESSPSPEDRSPERESSPQMLPTPEHEALFAMSSPPPEPEPEPETQYSPSHPGISQVLGNDNEGFISFGLHRRVMIVGEKVPIFSTFKLCSTDRMVSLACTEVDAHRISRQWNENNPGKKARFDRTIAICSGSKQKMEDTLIFNTQYDSDQIRPLLEQYRESSSKSFKVELVTYFRGEIIDAEAIAAAAAAAEAETVQLTKLTSKKRTKDVKNNPESPTQPAKSPRVADAADNENTAENTAEISTSQVTTTTKQRAELKTKREKEDKLSRLSREIEKQWQCQHSNCRNYDKGICWLSPSDNHIPMVSSEISTWVFNIMDDKATLQVPGRSLIKRLLERDPKFSKKTAEAATEASKPPIQPNMPAVIFPPSAPAAPAAPAANGMSDLMNVMMMRCLTEMSGGRPPYPPYLPYPSLDPFAPFNPPFNLPANTPNPLYPSNPTSPTKASTNQMNPADLPPKLPSISPPPQEPKLPLPSSPLPTLGSLADHIRDEYFNWLITKWPMRADSILDAKEALQQEVFELDMVRKLPMDDIDRMNIPRGIFYMIRDGLKDPVWLQRLRELKQEASSGSSRPSTGDSTLLPGDETQFTNGNADSLDYIQ
ncbi:hypothetical protein FQN55_007082 [Onygenales sp. PD_40]|nr:hypothetical protein FQN55_007082 [Onygenales sp. PD_40]